ncbi:unnamed protein product [Paramecium octaurelia]|uniref:Uncharacterized protein n=1 Tax=Paramecium octaurelia TaxID=43137 RepID=A0A8S1TMC0_PAROT|nr:unnamed protein product [Paramecium octaurelia]
MEPNILNEQANYVHKQQTHTLNNKQYVFDYFENESNSNIGIKPIYSESLIVIGLLNAA